MILSLQVDINVWWAEEERNHCIRMFAILAILAILCHFVDISTTLQGSFHPLQVILLDRFNQKHGGSQLVVSLPATFLALVKLSIHWTRCTLLWLTTRFFPLKQSPASTVTITRGAQFTKLSIKSCFILWNTYYFSPTFSDRGRRFLPPPLSPTS